MGVISMVPMLKYGYSTRHTMGVIAASGTITQLIPPSLVLVVLADVLGRSVGDMYAGAIGPSIIQVVLFMHLGSDRQHFPATGRAGAAAAGALAPRLARRKKCLRGMIPSLGLIFLVLGTIFMGLATPIEAGAMGVAGALALAAASYGTLTWKLLYEGMSSTMRLTAMVIFILIGVRVFSLVFQGVGDRRRGQPGGQLDCTADRQGGSIVLVQSHQPANAACDHLPCGTHRPAKGVDSGPGLNPCPVTTPRTKRPLVPGGLRPPAKKQV